MLKHVEGERYMKNHTQVEVPELPQCDFCKQNPLVMYQEAHYDFRTKSGHWAYGCREHFKRFGVGLGLGRGQELVLTDENKRVKE